MASEVTAIYNLVDRMSAKAKKIQKEVAKLEATLERVDKLNKQLSRSNDFAKYANSTSRSLDKVNTRLKRSAELTAKHTKEVERQGRSMQRVNTHLDKGIGKLELYNKGIQNTASSARQLSLSLMGVENRQRSLSRALTPVTVKTNNQSRAFTTAAASGLAFAETIEHITNNEHQLTRAMTAKNLVAREQRHLLRGIQVDGRKATVSLGQLSRQTSKMQRMRDAFNDRRQQSVFVDSFESGLGTFTTLKKVAAMMPVIGMGIGGLINMVNGLSAAVLGTVGSLTKLSGALSVLPGLYMAGGAGAFAGAGIGSAIIKPAIEASEELLEVQEKLRKAQKLAARTNSPAARAKVNDLLQEEKKLLEALSPAERKFNKELEKTKSLWTSIWQGPNGAQGDSILVTAAEGLTVAQKMMQKFSVFTRYSADSFGRLVNAAERLSNNRLFIKAGRSAGSASFTNLNTVLRIAENLAPITAGIASSAATTTGLLLGQVEAWSQTYTNAENVKVALERIDTFFVMGIKYLNSWKSILGDVFSIVNSLASPFAVLFTNKLKGGVNRGAKDAKAFMGSKEGELFTSNSINVMEAMGGVLRSLATMMATVGKNKAAADATVEFLKIISGAIEAFGKFAAKALAELGPSVNEMFKALGDAYKGSGDIIIQTIKLIVDANTKLIEVVNKIPYQEKIFAISTAITALSGALGSLIGSVAGMGAGGLGAITAITDLFGKMKDVTAAAGALGYGGKLAKGASRVAGAFNPVMIVNTAPIPVLVTNPGGVGGGPGGLARGVGAGGAGAALTKWGSRFLRVGPAVLMASIAADTAIRKDKSLVGRGANKASEGLEKLPFKGPAYNNPKPKQFGDPSNPYTRTFGGTKATRKGGSGGSTFLGGLYELTSIPRMVTAAYDKATANTKTGGNKLKAQTNAVGAGVTQSLSGWASAVNKIMASMGAPVSSAPTTSTPGGGGIVGKMTNSVKNLASGVTGGGKTGDSNAPAARGGGITAGLSAAMGPAVQLALGMGGRITSGLRPGAITSSGLPSDHATGNAIDVAGSPALMAQIAHRANSLVGVKQVIYSPVGWSRNGGPFSPVSDAKVRADHYDHVHIAMGGSGKGGLMSLGPTVLPGVPGMGNTMFGQAVQARAQALRTQLMQSMGTSMGADPASMGTSAPGDLPSMIAWAASMYGAKADGLLRIAQRESGMNINAHNAWDSNARKGTPSKGLFQFIQPTYNSMSAMAMAANPSAWAGVNNSWLDPKAQALTAAWAFTHGQGSHWATAKWYGDGGDFIARKPHLIGVGDKEERVTITPKHKGKMSRKGSSSIVVNLHLNGVILSNEESAQHLADIIGPKIGDAIIKASANSRLSEEDL